MLTCYNYLTPGSLDEAFEMMASNRGRHRIIAGATDTLPWAREGRAAETADTLRAALKAAHGYNGLSVIRVPVYCGPDELGGLGAWGDWNVGNWCEDVQAAWIKQDL